MDPSLISSALSGITTAMDIGKTALSARDASLVAEGVTKLNESLLKAQQDLSSAMAQLLNLQQEHIKITEELRIAKEAMAERGRYKLVKIADGQFVCQLDVGAQEAGAGEPGSVEPMHYACQSCFSLGRKVVLQKVWASGWALHCPGCKTNVQTSMPGG